MKLLLTSDGLTTKNLKNFFISILDKKPKDCSLLLIFYKLDIEPKVYIKDKKEEIGNTGIIDITYFDMHKEKFTDMNKKFDVIWVCGGNTYCILDRMRKTGVLDYLKSSTQKSSSLYVGVSAGSIIAGPEIKIANWGSERDDNIINLKDLTGLNFTNISILPHFKQNMQNELDEFKKIMNYPVIEITDEEAVYIEDNKYAIIK